MGSADSSRGLADRLPAAVQRDWDSLDRRTAAPQSFDPGMVDGLPIAARRWLTASIAAGAPLLTRLRMRQHGRINIRGWRTFTAEQVINTDGYVWACSTRMFGLPVRGYDRLSAGEGDMVYRVIDRITVVDESGPDLTRSAVGRLVAESCWVPASTLRNGASWTAIDDHTAAVSLRYADATHTAEFRVADSGRLESVRVRRWASIDREPYAWHDFGADVHEEITVDGFTIPSRVTVGYGYGGADWPACAFIELTVDRAEFA